MRTHSLRAGTAFALSSVGLAAVAAGPQPVFDVHFAVITQEPAAQRAATAERLRAEVDVLNERFITEDGRPIVKFRFKSASLYDEIKGSPCEFVKLGDSTQRYDTDRWAAAFNACHDASVRDPRAINFIVYKSYDQRLRSVSEVSHGRLNSYRPYVLVDWQRLGHGSQSPEEHEMGHAFGLGHECFPGAKINTSTNIMASAECGKGSGGRRNLGFNATQERTILQNAAGIKAALGSSPFDGENCQLEAPPPGAGDETVRAEIAKIFPRRKDFPARYTGCQVTWLQGKERWTMLGVAYFRDGVVASYWSPSTLCEYRGGKAQGPNADKCPAATALPAGSMAPGCAQKILGRGGNAGCQPDSSP